MCSAYYDLSMDNLIQTPWADSGELGLWFVFPLCYQKRKPHHTYFERIPRNTGSTTLQTASRFEITYGWKDTASQIACAGNKTKEVLPIQLQRANGKGAWLLDILYITAFVLPPTW